jgi:hypothetical protein
MELGALAFGEVIESVRAQRLIQGARKAGDLPPSPDPWCATPHRWLPVDAQSVGQRSIVSITHLPC